MTIINQSELDKLSTLDQILMWSVMSINASNLDARNTNISDNAAIRAESKDYISWQVIQDEKGAGRFTFTALLPIVNTHPLEDKPSLLSRVWSYSPYDPSMVMSDVVAGFGWQLGSLPNWIDTVEKLLAYCAELGTKIIKLAPLVRGSESFVASIRQNYWANCQYQIVDSAYGSQMVITGYLTINWHQYIAGKSLINCLNPYSAHASNINCNFPDLVELWGSLPIDVRAPIEEVPLPVGLYSLPASYPLPPIIEGDPGSVENLIDEYGQSYFIDDAVPDWYRDAIDNPPHLQTFTSGFGSVGSPDSTAPKLIESLPICKEQDPSVVNYGRTPLSQVLTKQQQK